MRLPALFVSHGSPATAIEPEDDYVRALRGFAGAVKPRAIAIVSAHWETPPPVRVTSNTRPALIYDFAGFPMKLFRLKYACPGSPGLAREIVSLLPGALEEPKRGLDHGAWVPLRLMYPGADVPIVQVSLPAATPQDLLETGRSLSPLRERGVLLIGSGGIAHNAGRLVWTKKEMPPEPWAAEFDAWAWDRIVSGDLGALVEYRDRGPNAALAAPTPEHLHPLFVILGSAPGEKATNLYEGFRYGSLSMRCFALGFSENPHAPAAARGA